MKMFIPTGVILLAFLAGGNQSFAQQNQESQEAPVVQKLQKQENRTLNRPGMRMDRVLNLTEEQQKKVDVLRHELLKKSVPLNNTLDELKAKYHTLMSADDPDQQAINKNIDEQSKLVNRLMRERADFTIKYRKVLTEEQRVVYDSHAPDYTNNQMMRNTRRIPGTTTPNRRDFRRMPRQGMNPVMRDRLQQ